MTSTSRTPAALALNLALILMIAACSKQAAQVQAPPTVVVATPLTQRVSDWDDYSGRFEAVETVDVRPRVGGLIQSVHFKDGEKVRQGQLLFVIDPRPYAAALARARADVAGARAALANADSELARSNKLVSQQLISKAQAEQQQAQQLQAAASLAAAEAAEATHELDLSFTRVIAPISGRTSNRRLSAGNIVAADTTLLTTLVSESPIRFLFDAPESALLKYRRDGGGARNSQVDIRLQDETEYRWKGRIDFIDNALDRGSGTIRGRAVIDNPDGFISPGMFGQMRLFATESFDALMLPDEAIVTDQTRHVVYTIDGEGVVTQKVVQPGRLVDGLRVIRQGLAPTDRVIISGVQRARPGKKVTVKEGVVTAFPSGVSRGENSALSMPQSSVPPPKPTVPTVGSGQ